MKLVKKIAATTALLVSVGLAAGCTPQRKPLPPAPGYPPSVTQPAPKYGVKTRDNLNRYNYNRTNIYPNNMVPPFTNRNLTTNQRQVAMSSLAKTNNEATHLARKISKNPFVDNATVIIVGKTAYIGLDLKNNVNAHRTTVTKKAVTALAKRNPRVNTVVVVADPDALTRIKRIAQGVASGNPISTFTQELSDIGRRLIPSVR